MKIRIDFADIPDGVFDGFSANIMSDNLVDYIQNEYFNGAENAVKYLRTDIEFEYVELELMPS